MCTLCVFNFSARSLILELIEVYGYEHSVDEWGIFGFVYIISTFVSFVFDIVVCCLKGLHLAFRNKLFKSTYFLNKFVMSFSMSAELPKLNLGVLALLV